MNFDGAMRKLMEVQYPDRDLVFSTKKNVTKLENKMALLFVQTRIAAATRKKTTRFSFSFRK
jgi:hypothetical protein